MTLSEPTQSLEVQQMMQDLASQAVLACGAALARVWLIGPGDSCETCAMREECPSRIRCLHLVASAGSTTRLDGAFQRFPLGAREMGRVAVTGDRFVANAADAAAAFADAAWLSAHRVASFAAVALKSGARILGVVAVFSRRSLSVNETQLMQLAAAQAARAIEAVTRPGAARVRDAGADVAAAAPASLDDAQRRAIEHALSATGGRISGKHGAAELLGIHPNTLTSRMIRLGMRVRRKRIHVRSPRGR
jgi:transcriptional regulator with GAF, ATPase, and Fis domain